MTEYVMNTCSFIITTTINVTNMRQNTLMTLTLLLACSINSHVDSLYATFAQSPQEIS